MAKMPEPIEVIRDKIDPQEIALQYIHHEFLKLFRDRSDDFYKELSESVKVLPATLGTDLLWQLLAGLAEGYKLKWTYRILTDDSYTWRLEKLRLDDITLSGMSPFLNSVIADAHRKPSEFAKIWKAHPEYAMRPDCAGMRPYPERDDLPIMIHEKPNGLNPFDGMRRTCMAAIAGKTEITAWVGRRTGHGKVTLNPDKPLFMFATYKESQAKHSSDVDALTAISKLYVREYNNGAAAVTRGLEIFAYSEDETLRAVGKQIHEAIQSTESTPKPATDHQSAQ